MSEDRFTYYATIDYSDRQDEKLKQEALSIKDYVLLSDQITGYKYALHTQNGIAAIAQVPIKINIVKPPNKVKYFKDTESTIEGIQVEAVLPTGESFVIDNSSIVCEPKIVRMNTEEITVKYVEYGQELTSSFAIEVVDANPTYTVSSVDGASYGFTLQSDGYYRSQNINVSSSAAVCRVDINTPIECNVYIDCINAGESNYDYGIISKFNKELGLTYSSNDSNVTFYSFNKDGSSITKTIDYGVVGSGFFYVKFRKDSGGNYGADSLRFKVRFE